MDLWKHSLIISTLFVLSSCRGVIYQEPENQGVSYRELETLGITCNPYDTCNTTSKNRNASGRNCECDNLCTFFGDCCLDAPNTVASAPRMSSDIVCSEILPHAGYYTIGKCMRDWRDAEVKRKCEDRPSPLDPLTFVPVTTRSITFTYKNHYCAKCNKVSDTLLYWKLGADCPDLDFSMDNYVHHNLTYNRNISSWGVYVQGRFHRCFFQPIVPREKRFMRFCYPDVISKCPRSWRDELIREKCESYTAYLHIREDYATYRNIHCALCNNVRPDRLSCESTFERDFERASFTTLFDINLAKGNEIGGGGTAPKCAEGEVYDLIFKRCQKLSCGLPFLELRDGVCVPKSGK